MGSSFQDRIPPYVALLPVCLGVFIAADDQTVIVTVLPQIMLDMKVPIGELHHASWTITGYLLGYVAAMPLIGRVSDVWGHRSIFILSMVVFMVGSATVALSSSLGWLVFTRVFQAMGAGALVPVSFAIVGDLFPHKSRGMPLGIVGASAEAGGVLGPLWGGIITRYMDWQWIFWMNIPLGIVILFSLTLLCRPSPRYQTTVDYIGGGLIAISLVSLTLGLSRIHNPDPLMAAYLLGSATFLSLFVMRQNTTVAPLLPLSLFSGWTFKAANATQLLVGGALIMGMLTIPLMANTVLGQTPLEGGLLLMRLTIAIPFGAVLGGLACQRLNYHIPTVAGLILIAAGFFLMSQWSLEISDPSMSVHLATAGLGFGFLIAPLTLSAINSVGIADRGTAAALITTTRMVGMTLGLAALTAWGTGRFHGMVATLQLPLALTGETPEQTRQKTLAFDKAITETGVTLFNDFFLVAMGVSLIAIIPALVMVWSKTQKAR